VEGLVSCHGFDHGATVLAPWVTHQVERREFIPGVRGLEELGRPFSQEGVFHVVVEAPVCSLNGDVPSPVLDVESIYCNDLFSSYLFRIWAEFLLEDWIMVLVVVMRTAFEAPVIGVTRGRTAAEEADICPTSAGHVVAASPAMDRDVAVRAVLVVFAEDLAFQAGCSELGK